MAGLLGGGDVGLGAAGAAGKQIAYNKLRDFVLSQGIEFGSSEYNSWMQIGSALIGGVIGGGTGAATAAAGELYNRQLHSIELEFIASKAKEYAALNNISVAEAERLLMRGALYVNDDDWQQHLTLYGKEELESYEAAFGWLAMEASTSNLQIYDSEGRVQPAFTSSVEERADETIFASMILDSPEGLRLYTTAANITTDEASIAELLFAYAANPTAEGEAHFQGMLDSLKGLAGLVDPDTYKALHALYEQMEKDPKGTTDRIIAGLKAQGGDFGANVLVDFLQLDLQDFRDGKASLEGQASMEVLLELATLGTVTAVTAAKYGLRTSRAVGELADTAVDAERVVSEVGGDVAKGVDALDDVKNNPPAPTLGGGGASGKTFDDVVSGTPATATERGFVNSTKNCEFGVCMAPQTPEEQALAIQIMAGKDTSGQMTEDLIEMMAQRQGYEVLPGGKYGSNNGFDAVLKKPDGTVTIIVDGKPMPNGMFQLSYGAGGKVQLTDEWISAVLDKLPENSPARVAIETAIDDGKLVTAVGGVYRVTGEVVVTPVEVPSSSGTPPKPPSIPPSGG